MCLYIVNECWTGLPVAQNSLLCLTFLSDFLVCSKEPGQQRVKRWAFGIDEVLKDPIGREQFLKFLESEFSSENLRCRSNTPSLTHRVQIYILQRQSWQSHVSRFWLAVQELKKRPIREVPARVQEIWQEFLAPGAPSAINVDSKSYDKTTQNVKDPGRYAFEDAQVCRALAPVANER